MNANGLEEPRFDVKEAQSALRELMRLETLLVNDYLVVVKSEFDSNIGGEPYIALMLLYNMKMGVFMAREDLVSRVNQFLSQHWCCIEQNLQKNSLKSNLTGESTTGYGTRL